MKKEPITTPFHLNGLQKIIGFYQQVEPHLIVKNQYKIDVFHKTRENFLLHTSELPRKFEQDRTMLLISFTNDINGPALHFFIVVIPYAYF